MTHVTAIPRQLKANYTVEFIKHIGEAEKLDLSIMLTRIFRLMNSYDTKIKSTSVIGEFWARFNLPDSMMGFGILVKSDGGAILGTPLDKSWKDLIDNVACITQILVGSYMLPPIGEGINWNEYYDGSNSGHVIALGIAIDHGIKWPAYTDEELPNEIIEFYEDYLL